VLVNSTLQNNYISLCLWQEKEGLEAALQKDKRPGNEAEKFKLERVRNLNTLKHC